MLVRSETGLWNGVRSAGGLPGDVVVVVLLAPDGRGNKCIKFVALLGKEVWISAKPGEHLAEGHGGLHGATKRIFRGTERLRMRTNMQKLKLI